MRKSALKYYKFFLLLSFVSATSVLAKDIKTEEISMHMESIQLAAFKKSKTELDKKNFLTQYDTCTIFDGKFYRIFIVNIERNRFENLLFLTRKIYPDAFRGTKKIEDLLGKKRDDVHQSMPLLDQRIVYHDTLLNAHSILQTHRNFF
jgi:hypothetical protein